jgi:hypothetical protein
MTSPIEDALKLVRQMKAGVTIFKTPYEAGYNCGAAGPSEVNCHFMWFATPELTREWDRGKADGEKSKRPALRRGAGQ